MAVLLATDGSPSALEAAEWLNHWNILARSAVSVVTVVAPQMTYLGGGGYVLPAAVYDAPYPLLTDDAKQAARRVLAYTTQYLTACRVVRAEILVGQPVPMIVDYAAAHLMDVIVMGRRGHSAVGNFVDSVSFGILQRSSIPVTLVPAAPGRARRAPSSV